MQRRRYLGTLAGLAAGASAGCLSSLGGGGPTAPPTVTDRPDAVYIPSHIEGMAMAGMGMGSGVNVALSFSFPHRFWLVTGTNRELVSIREQDSVHMMVSLWNGETGVAIPSGSVSTKITKGGEPVASKRMWPMLSQNMGFHYGDNVALDGDGTYEVEVAVDPVGARRTGAFAGEFAEPVSTTVEFEFSQEKLDEVMYEMLDDRAGERDAVAPMQMEMMPVPQAQKAADLPGTVLGEGESGDATVVATTLDTPPEGVEGAGTYLAVSPRTPYNRYPLPFASLSATVSSGGTPTFDDHLRPTLDPELGIHYGAPVGELSSGDELTVSVGAPPQLARHEGYEMAFFEMPDVTVTV